MSEPFFSIIVPTFNRSDLVPHTIRSVLAQTYRDWEAIVCDNCSTDDTSRVVSRFSDPRITYIKTPRHMVIADNWEFARRRARGTFICMLADDDALTATALERFRHEITRHDADFLFCKIAEYRDASFAGPYRNSLQCPSFSTLSRVMAADDFIQSLFLLQLNHTTHPSAFVFAKSLGDLVATRCGRLFQTNGVEFFAWPSAAAFAKRIISIDAPLTICGRTTKSWGSNLILLNPGKKRIKKFIADVDPTRRRVPLQNFTMVNLMAEGILTAKALAPEQFATYELDEHEYLRRTMEELDARSALGVNVSTEINEVLRYLERHPILFDKLTKETHTAKLLQPRSLTRRIRSMVGDLGARRLRGWFNDRAEARRLRQAGLQKVRNGDVHSDFQIWGADFGFRDATGCAAFLTEVVSRQHADPDRIAAQ